MNISIWVGCMGVGKEQSIGNSQPFTDRPRRSALNGQLLFIICCSLQSIHLWQLESLIIVHSAQSNFIVLHRCYTTHVGTGWAQPQARRCRGGYRSVWKAHVWFLWGNPGEGHGDVQSAVESGNSPLDRDSKWRFLQPSSALAKLGPSARFAEKLPRRSSRGQRWRSGQSS